MNPGAGGTTPMLPAAASMMTQAMRGAELGERGLDRRAVVVRQHDGVGGDVRRDARASRGAPA